MKAPGLSRLLAAAALWAVAYNLVWGIAWFAFMHREWLEATAAIERPLPWTPPFWIAWVMLTLPIGVAVVAYGVGRARSVGATAALAVWAILTAGMASWGWRTGLSRRVLALDSVVNLVALLTASLAARPPRVSSS